MFAMLFPKIADNNYLGSRLVVYIFIPFLLLMTWRSIIHLFYAEFGLHGIANMIVLDGSPDPMPVIYAFFSLWGLIQLLFCAFAHAPRASAVDSWTVLAAAGKAVETSHVGHSCKSPTPSFELRTIKKPPFIKVLFGRSSV